MTIQPIALRTEGDNIRVVASPQLLSSAGGTGGGGGLTAEEVRDTIAAALVAGANITITPNDGADTITIGATGLELSGAAASAIAAHLAAGDPHPAYTTSAELTSALAAYLTTAAAPELIRDTIGAALVAGSNATITVNDAGDTITIAGPDLSAYLATSAAPELIRDTIGATLVAGSNVTITVNDAGDTITIAATGGGGSSQTFSRIAGLSSQTCFSIPGVVFSSTYSNTALAANTAYMTPWYCPSTVTIDQLGTYCAGASAGSKLRVGVYNAGNDAIPTTLVADSGELDTATAGTKTGAASATFGPGYFVLLVVSNGTPAVGVPTAGGSHLISNGFDVPRNFTAPLTYGALPSTAPTPTSSTPGDGTRRFFGFLRLSS